MKQMNLKLDSKRQPLNQWHSQEVSEKYKSLSKVGEGSYGQVFKAHLLNDPQSFVALKKIDESKEFCGFPITALREIRILRTLNHQNVIKLLEVATQRGHEENKATTYLVFEYCEHDLEGLAKKINFSISNLRILMKQLLLGIKEIHSKDIIHRDLKLDNILYNNKGEIKIADFGLAKKYKKPMTERVQCLKYRAPERLLGEKNYTNKIDIWSAGIIFAELLLKKQLFYVDRESNFMQLEQIFSRLGSINDEDWPEAKDLPYYNDMIPKFSKFYPKTLAEYIRKVINIDDDYAIDLLDKMLQLNPSKRYSAEQCLDHPFFEDVNLPEDLDQMVKIEGEYKKLKPEILKQYKEHNKNNHNKQKNQNQKSQNSNEQQKSSFNKHKKNSHSFDKSNKPDIFIQQNIIINQQINQNTQINYNVYEIQQQKQPCRSPQQKQIWSPQKQYYQNSYANNQQNFNIPQFQFEQNQRLIMNQQYKNDDQQFNLFSRNFTPEKHIKKNSISINNTPRTPQSRKFSMDLNINSDEFCNNMNTPYTLAFQKQLSTPSRYINPFEEEIVPLSLKRKNKSQSDDIFSIQDIILKKVNTDQNNQKNLAYSPNQSFCSAEAQQ